MIDFDSLSSTLSQATKSFNTNISEMLPLDQKKDIEAATRGRIANLPNDPVLAAGNRKAWDIKEFDFLQARPADTVNPSLWRMAQLNTVSGLFEVTDGVWQARAFDYANMTVIRGNTGWIIVDPLMSVETSAAAMKVVNQTLGERPISAVILTHTHPDHFAGISGVIDATTPPPIYAPAKFMDYAASEGVIGGNHTSRRAIYQFGIVLSPGEKGLVDGGIGKTVSKGQRTFVAPSKFVDEDDTDRSIDGVRFKFMMASGTEAPAEFTFLLPDHKVLCMAEVCTQTMHNLMPPRGAQVRDALLWARCIDKALTLFSDQADILINCHNWPVFGRNELKLFLEEQRDIYKYTHDQTLRMANIGLTPLEIADEIQEPDWLSEKFHSRGYYGTLKFNSRAVYQRYFGFFDGNPVNLDPLPPEKMAKRFVDAVGGHSAAVDIATQAIENDDLQWAATILSYLVFSDKENQGYRGLLALVFRHIGFREESGIMRNFYLTGALELEDGVKPVPMAGGRNADLAATLSVTDWFDAFALRLNPEKASGLTLQIDFLVDGKKVSLSVERQTEFARIFDDMQEPNDKIPDATVEVTIPLLERLSAGEISVNQMEKEGAIITGNKNLLSNWIDLHDKFDMWFNVVTP